MSQSFHTAAALKRLIQVRMNALADVQDDDEQVFANDVEWHQPDEEGCNWDMNGYRGPAGYASEIRLLVNRLRREYRLSEGPRLFR
jgi:hypothetical protein